MKRIMLLMVIVSLTVYALPPGKIFLQVRYLGGTTAASVSPKEWDNHLTVTAREIRLETQAGDRIIIPAADVTRISYGQEAHRRVQTLGAKGILLAPLAWVGLFRRDRRPHFVSIEYTTADNGTGTMLLQGHKNNYRALLVALKEATGAPVYVAPEERHDVPDSLNPVESTTPEPAATPAPPPAPARTPPPDTPPPDTYPPPPNTPATTTGTVNVSSTPSGAEIYVDGNFVGNTPAVLKLPPGQHRFEIKATGLTPWSREVQILSGSEISLAATLK